MDMSETVSQTITEQQTELMSKINSGGFIEEQSSH